MLRTKTLIFLMLQHVWTEFQFHSKQVKCEEESYLHEVFQIETQV